LYKSYLNSLDLNAERAILQNFKAVPQ
jgi:hypothetical protein